MFTNKLSISTPPLLTASLVSLISIIGVDLPAMALTPLTFSSTSTSTTSTTSTRGWSFNVLSDITVDGLSIWDENGDGLGQSHDVGLWDSVGTLLASATIASGTSAPLDTTGQFRTVGITPIVLTAGNSYVAGATFLNGSPDTQNISSSFTTIPEIAFVDGRVINNGVPSLTFPTSSFGFPFIGGSFQVQDATPIPFEFSPTLGLLLIGAGVGAERWWRSRRRQEVSLEENA